ncbi:hypothetical protein FQZ97_1228700 [compost metagenome]
MRRRISAFMAAETGITSMPMLLSLARLSLSTLLVCAQNSGSRRLAICVMAVCCASVSFFQTSRLMLTIWEIQVWLVG